jgi:hypothetical protein
LETKNEKHINDLSFLLGLMSRFIPLVATYGLHAIPSSSSNDIGENGLDSRTRKAARSMLYKMAATCWGYFFLAGRQRMEKMERAQGDGNAL